MMTDINQTQCGDCFAMCTNIESLYILETNIMLCVNYRSILKKKVLHLLIEVPELSANFVCIFSISQQVHFTKGSQVVLVIKNSPASAGDIRDSGSVPGSGRSLGKGHGNPLQYSCLENPMDRGAWRAIVHGVTESWTQLKQLSMQACI